MNAGILQLGKLIDDLSITLVDIGSRGGLDEDLSSIRQYVHAIGFEPDPAEADRLSSLPNTGWKSSKHLPPAIGASDGAATLYVPDSPEGASMRPHNEDMIKLFGYENLHRDRREIAITARTLDSLQLSGELPRADYLKIDIEGVELEVLQAGRQTLANCVAIKVECSFLEQRVAQARTWEVATFLEADGFHIVDIHDLHRWRRRPLPSNPYKARAPMLYSRGQISQCDLIAFRWPDSSTSPRNILRTIIIASALGYFDFAVNLMREFPEAGQIARTEFGVHVEESLFTWSRFDGRRATLGAIFQSIRGLVPLIKSLFRGIPGSNSMPY